MTNSSDKNKKMALKKSKGPLRLGAIVPLCVILGGTIAYFYLFFDLHLRKGIEFVGTKINKARVDVGLLRTSFLRGSLLIKNIEVTDFDEPMKNKLDIGNIKFQFSWDALLRFTVYIQEASITEIKTGTPRKKSGAVPQSPPDPKKESLVGKLMATAMQNAKAEFSKSPIADLVRLLGEFDPAKELESFKSNLASLTRISEIKNSLTEKQTQWQNRINDLPKSSDFDAFKDRINRIESTDLKDVGAIQTSIEAAQRIQKEVDEKAKVVQTVGPNISSEVNGFVSEIQNIEKAVNQDLDNLKSKLKLPSLDVGDYSAALFGTDFVKKVDQVQYYVHLARKYFPKKKSKEEKKEDALKPHERGKGVNISFGRPNAYPAFWLQKTMISSTATDEYGANMEGTLKNVTTDPPLIGRPTELILKGDFPRQDLRHIAASLTLDYAQEVASESFSATIESYPIAPRDLSVSDQFKFGLKSSRGQSGLSAHFKENSFDIGLKHGFRETGFDIQAQPAMVQEALQTIVQDIHGVDLQARAHGLWSDVKWELSSNLGLALQQGLQKLLKQKLDEAHAKVKQFVEAQIQQKRAELEKQYAELKTKLIGEVENRLKEAAQIQTLALTKLNIAQDQKRAFEDRIKREAEAKVEAEKQRAKQQAEAEAQKAAGQLAPKIKLPF